MPRPTSASGFSRSRSATSRSAPSSGASESEAARATSCPAAPSVSRILLANIRSGAMATTRAKCRALEGAPLAELVADALRPSPHLHDLGTPLAHLGKAQDACHARLVELRQHALDRGRGGGVAEAVRDEDAPVPVGLRVGLGVDLA